jgi:aldose 1-epimerase
MTQVLSEPFGVTGDGTPVERYTLESEHLVLRVLTWGASVQTVVAPDRHGDRSDVVLGFDDLSGYLGDHPYFGAVVGRYANRIADGRFRLDGTGVQVPPNDRGHALHGGPQGFDRRVWSARPAEGESRPAVTLSRLSPDGEMGFPGTLDTRVTYTLAGNDVRIDYRATTDRATVVNLTQHTYFNLGGESEGSVESHLLKIPAGHFLPIDAGCIPLDGLAPVQGTPFDFRRPKQVWRDIAEDDPQLAHGLGYDHSWVLDGPYAPLALAARVTDPGSGRMLEVLTSEPAVQFYSGNQLDGSVCGKGGRRYGRRQGLCLETQHLPDSPNRPEFPRVVLRPGETYESTTVWRFSTV